MYEKRNSFTACELKMWVWLSGRVVLLDVLGGREESAELQCCSATFELVRAVVDVAQGQAVVRAELVVDPTEEVVGGVGPWAGRSAVRPVSMGTPLTSVFWSEVKTGFFP